LRIDHGSSHVSQKVTISIGVATVVPPRDDETGIPALIKAADDALYRAKEAGRNRVRALTGAIRVAEPDILASISTVS